ALAAPGFGGKEVAFGIDGNAVHAVEFTRLASALAEAGHDFEGIAVEDVHAVVHAVGQKDIFLLGIFGEGDVPNRARALGSLIKEGLLDKSTIGFEDLNAVVDAVADIKETIDGNFGAVHGIAELLGGRRIRVVGAQIRVVRFVAVRAPVALVLSGV